MENTSLMGGGGEGGNTDGDGPVPDLLDQRKQRCASDSTLLDDVCDLCLPQCSYQTPSPFPYSSVSFLPIPFLRSTVALAPDSRPTCPVPRRS